MKVFVDTETSGLDPRHHSILSVCLGNKDIGYKTFHIRPDPDNIIDPKAMEVNKIDLDGLWEDQSIAFLEYLQTMFAEHGQLEPIGHNYMFDIGFIQQVLGRRGYEKFFSRRYLDTMIIAKFIDEALLDREGKVVHRGGYSLKSLCEEYDIENEFAHTAEGDVRATETLYHKLVDYIKI